MTPDIEGPIRNGGIGTAFAALAHVFARNGLNVTLLYTLGGYAESGNVERWAARYRAQGISFVPMPNYLGPRIDAPRYRADAYRVYHWLKQHEGEFDTVYYPDWHGEAYYALVAKKLGLHFTDTTFTVVTHSPSTWAAHGNYTLPSSIDDLDLEFLERKTVELSDRLISPSHYMLNWFARNGWRLPKDVSVIANCVPANITPPPARQRQATSPNELVFFGRLERRKGLELFCDALDQLTTDAWRRVRQVTFLGKNARAPGWRPIALIKRRARNWPAKVSVLTSFDRVRANAYLTEQHRLAVIPSLVENSPYSVLECLVQGIPFVAAEIGGIPEMIAPHDRQRLLFQPQPGALARLVTSRLQEAHTLGTFAAPPDTVVEAWVADAGVCRGAPKAKRLKPMPRVSVCLVHHDRPAFLAQALESLRRQTYRDFEVVLVDDGSISDEARQYLDSLEPEFRMRGWRLVRAENRYVGAARNLAAAHATGEYLLFMDDDNIARSHEIETFARAAHHSDADILTTVSDVFSGDKPRTDNCVSDRYWLPLGDCTALGVFQNCFGDANAFVRRAFFESSGGFTEDYGVGHEDWEFFAAAALSGAKMFVLPEPLFWYRTASSGMLVSGNHIRNHARSIRPYLSGPRAQLGGALGLALRMSLASSAPRAKSIWRPMAAQPRAWLHLGRIVTGEVITSPDLRRKFARLVIQRGLKVALRAAADYMRRLA